MENLIVDLPQVNKVIGHTTINHKIRITLNLTCDEYCLIDLIEKCKSKKIKFTYEESYKRLGYEKEVVNAIMNQLQGRKLLKWEEKEFRVTKLWIEQFEISQEEFDAFWEPMKFQGRTIRWTGSKFDAQKKYIKARREYEGSYLYFQKQNYFRLLFEKPERPIMAASVFLNMETKRFIEEFHTQLSRSIQGESDIKKITNRKDLFDD